MSAAFVFRIAEGRGELLRAAELSRLAGLQLRAAVRLPLYVYIIRVRGINFFKLLGNIKKLHALANRCKYILIYPCF